MANFGIGLGAFMSGLSQGMNTYNNMQESKDKKRLRDIQFKQLEQDATDKQALRDTLRTSADAAGKARQADIAGMVKPGETIGPDGVATPSYTVGDKSFKTQEEATAAADKQVGSFMEYYLKTSVPKMQEHWMKTGDIDKAQALNKWMEDENVKKGAKAWAGAVRSFQLGDREGFKKNLMAAYNQQGYFDDGMTATKIEDVKNDKGQLTGYAITFKDSTGKETTQNYDGDDVARLGLNALSPTEVLSYGMDQLKQANATRAELAKEGRTFQRDVTKLGIQQQNTLESQANQSQLRQAEEAEKRRNGGDSTKVKDANAIAGALKARGYDEKYISSIYPQLLGVERGSKSVTDRLDGYVAALAKSDLDFAALPPAQQVKKAQEMMAEVDKARGGETATPGSAPADSTPVQSGKGIPFWDSKTQTLIYR